MGKVEQVENLENGIDLKVEFEELKNRINRYAYRLESDYNFYKRIYMEHLDTDKATIKQQLNYENAKKQLENVRFYFSKYLVNNNEVSQSLDINDDDIKEYLGE